MYIIQYVLDLYLGAILGITGLSKAERPDWFAFTLRRYPLRPSALLPVLSYSLPWTEILLAVLLVSGFAQLEVGIIACVLFAAFLAIMLTSGQNEPCGCYNDGLGSVRDGAKYIHGGRHPNEVITLDTLHMAAVP